MTTHFPLIRKLYPGTGNRIFFCLFFAIFCFSLLFIFLYVYISSLAISFQVKVTGRPKEFHIKRNNSKITNNQKKKKQHKNNQRPKKKWTDITAKSQSAPGLSN